VPDACLDTVAGFEPCYTTIPLSADADGRLCLSATEVILQQAEAATAVALGPGLGRSTELRQLVAILYQEVAKPMVVDADGLNALAEQADVWCRPGGPRILTPHPGEFARWLGRSIPAEQRSAIARECAARCGVVVVLKGHGTVVTDGARNEVNTTGNPGMSTGGTGDVLTGLIAALCAQSMEPYDAARLGVHIHGLAGDLAAEELGEESLTARDLPRFFGRAFQSIRRGAD
ncbi:MAG: NAD(P)H-hydrate dehydratase, partial [Patescibacteria group bacterium]|nr:NAD(P)H-hydrate dehydratase [Patescibacteria group bacterium]